MKQDLKQQQKREKQKPISGLGNRNHLYLLQTVSITSHLKLMSCFTYNLCGGFCSLNHLCWGSKTIY